MDQTLKRRYFLQLSGGFLMGLGALGLSGCSEGDAARARGGATHLQLVYWGTAVRAKKTSKMVELYQKSHPTTTISSQYSDFSSYWPKLATQISGGSMPDLVQMDMRYIAQYVEKGLLLDLSKYIPQQIQLNDFNRVLLKSSEANNKVYAIPFGGNFMGLYYDADMLHRAGVPLPEKMHNWTWDGFFDYTVSIAKALGPNVYGTDDSSANIGTFEMFVRQRKKELFTHDGRRGFDRQDALDWFDYWQRLRKAGGCVPIDIQVAYNGVTPQQSSLISGKAAINFNTSNLIEGYQKASTHKLGLFTCPTSTGSSDPGYYLKASMLLGAAATTRSPHQVVDFINYAFSDTAAIKALGIERGIPGSAKAIKMLKPSLNTLQKTQLTLVELVTANSRPKIVLDPPGAGTVTQLLALISQGIAFEKMSVTEGVNTFITQVDKALERIG